MRVGYYGSRYLGWQVKTLIEQTPGVELVGVKHQATGWWGTAGEELDQEVSRHDPDLVVSVLTSHIFTEEEISVSPIINLHCAPLPEYRGCNGVAHAIINDDPSYGVTLHYVDKGIDTGQVIECSRFEIRPAETGRSLYDRAQLEAEHLFARWWPDFAVGLWPEAHAQVGPSNYYRRDSLTPYFNLADWPEGDHERIKRALDFPPFPGAR